MPAPYVSQRKLVENAMAAMLAAVEIYNKPQVSYREQMTVILVVNAWELILKAALLKAKRSIFYLKKPKQKYLSISLDDALERVRNASLWPGNIDGVAVTTNVQALAVYRDRAIHLYNAQGLGTVIYPFLQTCVLNFRDFTQEMFQKDLAQAISWQLLPLGATAPPDAAQFMRVDSAAAASEEVRSFMTELRVLMDKASASGADPSRIAVVYDIHMKSLKKMSSADLVVGVAADAPVRVVTRKSDPSDDYKYLTTELLSRANKKRAGRPLNSYDYSAVSWKHSIKTNKSYAWTHENGGQTWWSDRAVDLFSDFTDSDIAEIRREYGAELQRRRSANR